MLPYHQLVIATLPKSEINALKVVGKWALSKVRGKVSEFKEN